ncbi:hypothetical protein GVN16_08490 [Emticicia sp. CRIBPO]|uniref:hypothetical protein n=1 Tax=Emticicia sp. CRIBPO TaxID=2683258 RepID=UPI001412D1A3|nr:hypothetical protein [Emticicia sp. CRIBPO]NBA85794.1 hypothetical protein [Emticicia sp. CRIBPO]
MKTGTPILCPSANPKEGAILLGVVKENGEVSILENRLEIDNDFIQTASEGRELTHRFRFADTCASKGCANWSGNHCMVLDIARKFSNIQPASSLPDCNIRPQCRWFMQEGAEACKICPNIQTGNMIIEV